MLPCTVSSADQLRVWTFIEPDIFRWSASGLSPDCPSDIPYHSHSFTGDGRTSSPHCWLTFFPNPVRQHSMQWLIPIWAHWKGAHDFAVRNPLHALAWDVPVNTVVVPLVVSGRGNVQPAPYVFLAPIKLTQPRRVHVLAHEFIVYLPPRGGLWLSGVGRDGVERKNWAGCRSVRRFDVSADSSASSLPRTLHTATSARFVDRHVEYTTHNRNFGVSKVVDLFEAVVQAAKFHWQCWRGGDCSAVGLTLCTRDDFEASVALLASRTSRLSRSTKRSTSGRCWTRVGTTSLRPRTCTTNAVFSGSFLTEISVRSPWTFVIFII